MRVVGNPAQIFHLEQCAIRSDLVRSDLIARVILPDPAVKIVSFRF
jgi:hypothetical protein